MSVSKLQEAGFPPPYSESASAVPTPMGLASASVPASASASASAWASPPSPIPDSFTITRQSFWRSSFAICRDAPKPDNTPLYAIERHSGLFGKPSIALHWGPDKESPMMATVEIPAFHNGADVTLLGPPSVIGTADGQLPERSQTVHLDRRSGFFANAKMAFTWPAAGSPAGSTETFEWRHTSGDEVKELGGRSAGWKLVRGETDDVVAVYAAKNWHSEEKMHLFSFRGSALSDGSLDGKWRIVAAMTCLRVWDYEIKQRQAAAAGGG